MTNVVLYRRVSVPATAHPLVRDLFRLMHDERCGVVELARRAGFAKNTLQSWRTKHPPNVTGLEACLNALGYKLAIVPAGDEAPIASVVPPEWLLSPQEEDLAGILLTTRNRALSRAAIVRRMEITDRHLSVVICTANRKLRSCGWTISSRDGRCHIAEARADCEPINRGGANG